MVADHNPLNHPEMVQAQELPLPEQNSMAISSHAPSNASSSRSFNGFGQDVVLQLNPPFFIPDLNQPNPIDEEHQLDQQAIDNNLVGNQEPFNLDLQLGMALIPQLEPQANIEGSISNNSTVSRPCLGSEAWAQFVLRRLPPQHKSMCTSLANGLISSLPCFCHLIVSPWQKRFSHQACGQPSRKQKNMKVGKSFWSSQKAAQLTQVPPDRPWRARE